MEDENYPDLLKQIDDPPIVLYAQGCLKALKRPSISVVGSRQPSFTGRKNARAWSKVFAEQGFVVVSGLAKGIDGEAHQGCLQGKGQTIAVMGTGIDVVYPKMHRQLYDEIILFKH